MKKVIMYIATSLDGYIADNNGNVGFLAGDGSDNENIGSFENFFESVDTVILGYNTYNQIITELSPNQWAYKGKTSYVLTHKDIKNKDEIIFTSEHITDLILKLKEENGKDIWVCGGANIINQLHRANLIDEYAITIIPSILGNGIRLFEQTDKELKLKLKCTKNYNGMIDLVYEKR